MLKKDMWYMLEDFDGSIDYTGQNTLVLTPGACYEMDKRNLHYSILEDFYDEGELMRIGEKYFFEQLQWFKEFDSFLKDNIAVCKSENIDLAEAHYYQIAFFIDTLTIYYYVFSEFISKVKPEHIQYVYSGGTEKRKLSIYDILFNGNHLIREILFDICRGKGIPVSVVSAKTYITQNKQNALNNAIKNLSARNHVKSVYQYFKYRKFKRIYKRRPYENINILFLHAGVKAVDDVIRQCLGNAGNLFLKEKDEIWSLSTPLQKRVLRLDYNTDSAYAELKNICKGVSSDLPKEASLFDWVEKKCGREAKNIAVRYLQDFIENICSYDLYAQKKMAEFIKKAKIDFVITRASSEKDSISSLLAARIAGSKRVCFQHGCSPLDFKAWHITELSLMDIYFAADTEARNYFQHYSKYQYTGNCRVFESSHYLRGIKNVQTKNLDDVIIYVPHRTFLGFRSINNFCYPITWYYKLQKAILDFLSQRKDCRIIFKIAPSQEWQEESILQYIKDNNYTNVSVEKRDFYKCLGMAGRALFDYPSTALYEAGMAGMPVMSLCPRICPEWPAAVKNFGKSIQKFSTIPDAIEKIKRFIEEDPNSYRVNIPIAETDFVDDLFRADQKEK